MERIANTLASIIPSTPSVPKNTTKTLVRTDSGDEDLISTLLKESEGEPTQSKHLLLENEDDYPLEQIETPKKRRKAATKEPNEKKLLISLQNRLETNKDCKLPHKNLQLFNDKWIPLGAPPADVIGEIQTDELFDSGIYWKKISFEKDDERITLKLGGKCKIVVCDFEFEIRGIFKKFRGSKIYLNLQHTDSIFQLKNMSIRGLSNYTDVIDPEFSERLETALKEVIQKNSKKKDPVKITTPKDVSTNWFDKSSLFTKAVGDSSEYLDKIAELEMKLESKKEEVNQLKQENAVLRSEVQSAKNEHEAFLKGLQYNAN